MVRITAILNRVPVIKFRKGGAGSSAAPAAPARSPMGSCPAVLPKPAATAAAAPMSTSSIPDIDLPLRYQRRPMSQEEMDYINGGGVV